ncbi:MAG: hypothetical protein OXC31_26630 [Spirochaetaceae bacterium]|nr:hypothetical protein [Spirochaetaceae bacterium]
MAHTRYPVADELIGVIEPLLPRDKALTVADAILSHFSGNQVYFPLRTAGKRELRDAAIRREHDAGVDDAEIIRKHGISSRHLYRIISQR